MPDPHQPPRAYEINGQAADAQRFIDIACDPQRSVVVEACAGSGKTWLLVARMLRLLLAGAEPSELLAITFTRKAAQEMGLRLQELLHALALRPEQKNQRHQKRVVSRSKLVLVRGAHPTLATEVQPQRRFSSQTPRRKSNRRRDHATPAKARDDG